MKQQLFLLLILFQFCISTNAECQPVTAPVDSTLTLQKDSSEFRYVRIDKIFIIGNKQTKPQIIQRELSISEGDIFYLPDLREILVTDRNKLINTRLFNTVETHILEVDQFLIDIVIEVKERWYTFPIPIFTLADRNFNDWVQNQDASLDRINYGLRFYQYNVRGRNERLRGIVQFGFTKKFELSYTIPYINQAQKNGLTIFAGYAENKNISYKTVDHKLKFLKSDDLLRETVSGGFNFSRRSNFYTTQHFSLSYTSSQISDTIAQLNDNYFLEGKTKQEYFQLGYRFERDKRDIQAYPLSGYLISLQASKLGLGIFDDINLLEFRGVYGKYTDLGKQYYLSTSLTAKVTAPKEQPYMNFQALGYGRDYIRGYELYVIEGQHYLINKITFKKRLLLGDINIGSFFPIEQFQIIPIAIYLKTFFDSGFVRNNDYNPANSFLTDKYIFGGGLGLDIVSFYDVVIRLEYSINRRAEHGFFFHFIADI